MTPLPPKQGLKPGDVWMTHGDRYVMTPLPPKQGLKHRKTDRVRTITVRYDTTSTKTRIETDHGRHSLVGDNSVMTPLPPKQGLKPDLPHAQKSTSGCYDTTSTKTRIETM